MPTDHRLRLNDHLADQATKPTAVIIKVADFVCEMIALSGGALPLPFWATTENDCRCNGWYFARGGGAHQGVATGTGAACS